MECAILINEISLIAREAGERIMTYYQQTKPLNIHIKADKSPVTIADIQAHQIISKKLMQLTPEIPLLSEEDPVPWSIRRHWQRYWLIDPLDGTREFINNGEEFTVNIALINQGIAELGVIYAPVFDTLYAAENRPHHKLAWKMYDNKRQTIVCLDKNDPINVVTSKVGTDPYMAPYLHRLGHYQHQRMGSSLKFCLIAEGVAQVYPQFHPTSIWDTAAGQAIVCAAGGMVTNWQGLPLCYQPVESLLNPKYCVATVDLIKKLTPYRAVS